jgi:hypothetical protein
VQGCILDPEAHNTMGNVTKGETLEQIWNGTPFRELRSRLGQRRFDDLKPCNRCDELWDPHPKRPRLVTLVEDQLWRMFGNRSTDAAAGDEMWCEALYGSSGGTAALRHAGHVHHPRKLAVLTGSKAATRSKTRSPR